MLYKLKVYSKATSMAIFRNVFVTLENVAHFTVASYYNFFMSLFRHLIETQHDFKYL